MSTRMRLRREDGKVYLNRWGIEHDRIGGVFLHKMEAPDPGHLLHDHPWHFWRIVLKGGYTEERYPVIGAQDFARHAEDVDIIDRGVRHRGPRGMRYVIKPRRLTSLGLGTCHRISTLSKPTSWSLVVHGPKRRDREPGKLWGFYSPTGWVPGTDYRNEDRELWNDLI